MVDERKLKEGEAKRAYQRDVNRIDLQSQKYLEKLYSDLKIGEIKPSIFDREMKDFVSPNNRFMKQRNVARDKYFEAVSS